MREIERQKNHKILAEKKAVEEEEKKQKQKELHDFLKGGDEDDKVFAGGDNQFLEDDFM